MTISLTTNGHGAAFATPSPAPFDLADYRGAAKYLKRGGYWLFDAPEHSKWDWRGMAESLAMINRYDGATHYPYSVAQHSCIGHDFAPPEIRFHFLMHDLPEVIIGDKTQPVKDNERRRLDRISRSMARDMHENGVAGRAQDLAATALERARCIHDHEDDLVLSVLYQQAGFPLPRDSERVAVKSIDLRMLVTEVRDLMEAPPAALPLDIPDHIEPYPHAIKPWTWDRAADEYLKRLSLYIKV